MIIAGAGGHALEILTELNWLSHNNGGIYFFDDTDPAKTNFCGLPVLQDKAAAFKMLETDNRFIIGVGKPSVRALMFQHFTNWGAIPYSLISKYATIGHYNISLGKGLNIMAGAIVTASITIGDGTLINARAGIHHDVVIGSFCELSPGCTISGKVIIGNFTAIGSNAVILPGIKIGNNVQVGAGAVVTKNVPDGVIVKGLPGRW